ncbi:hypothetical protein [Leptolyngbya sp. GGD]|uniref:hypothetical protein n=1 Tax=Leptolyngbya sp. GGD TaxID=2997907 RepID=UPI00227BD09B|nr:hypothetical protein [Leptolyngbya sp. GGD]MCY6494582.1 hypothetical protein [Leptolyngbya sp. GGD]
MSRLARKHLFYAAFKVRSHFEENPFKKQILGLQNCPDADKAGNCTLGEDVKCEAEFRHDRVGHA